MKPKTKPGPSLSSDAEQETLSADWSEREHVSERSQLAAQNLVDVVGGPELAKHAIDVVEQSQSDSPGDAGDGNTPTSPTTVKQNASFLKALEDFETSLETPLMSGELTDWVTAAQRACEHLGVLLRRDVQRDHAALYASILREEPELSSQVEKLRETDEQLSLVDFGNVQLSLKQLLDRAQSAEQDEAKAALLGAKVVKQALAFVISARTQETAIATWFSESFNRDSGIGG